MEISPRKNGEVYDRRNSSDEELNQDRIVFQPGIGQGSPDHLPVNRSMQKPPKGQGSSMKKSQKSRTTKKLGNARGSDNGSSLGRGEFGQYGDGMRHPLSESDPEMGASNLAKRRGKSLKPTVKNANQSDLDDIYESNEYRGDSRGQYSLEDDLEEGRTGRQLPKKRRVRKGQSTNDRELYKRRMQENEKLRRKKQAAENALFPSKQD